MTELMQAAAALAFIAVVLVALIGRGITGRWPWQREASPHELAVIRGVAHELDAWRTGCGCSRDTQRHPEACEIHVLGLVARLEDWVRAYRLPVRRRTPSRFLRP